MKEIKLSNGKVALVDDEDFEYINQFKWRHHNRSGNCYAEHETRISGKRVTLHMHRVIMKTPSGLFVDHRDRDGLNNQKYNLRNCTQAQNNANRKARRVKMTSKFLGVAFEKDRQKWTARIRKDTIGMRLGNFNTEIEAAKAYNEAAIKYHGEFANLNVI